jgi:hypothetical protein
MNLRYYNPHVLRSETINRRTGQFGGQCPEQLIPGLPCDRGQGWG